MNDLTPTDNVPDGIPQEMRPYPIKHPVIQDYNVFKMSNKGKASLNPYELMRFLENSWVIYHGATPYRFNGYVYELLSETDIEQILYRVVNTTALRFPSQDDIPILTKSFLEDLIRQYSNTHSVSDLPEPYEGVESLAPYESELGLIAFKNGILNMDTLELLPFTPYIFVNMQIQAMYNPALKNHPVEQVYKNILPDDATRETFFRLAGYTIYSETLRIPGIFILYGGGVDAVGIAVV